MSDFVNTVDIIDDDVLMDGFIERSISGSFHDDKITGIAPFAFAYCTNLESVSFPNVTDIGSSAFKGSGLKAITPETFPLVTRVVYLYNSGIFEKSALETVDWPSLIAVDERNFFQNCKSLRSVNLPNLTGNSISFVGCTSLKDVNLPVITTTPSFDACSSLETITLPLAISCKYLIFNGCTNLRVIDLPSCTSTGSYYTYSKCTALKALILRSTTMCTYDGNRATFENSGISNGTGYIYVPRDLVESYKTDTNWSTYASQFRALEDFTVDGTITGETLEYCESFALDATELMFNDSNSQRLTMIGQFGIYDEIICSSSDNSVAIASNGVVMPMGEGTATITVTRGECSATCTVTVAAGVEWQNILSDISFNTGYLDGSNGDFVSASYYLTTDKFVVSACAGASINILTKVNNDARNSKICYYDENQTFISTTNYTSISDGVAVITSTVPENAVYAAISACTACGFSGIDITCNDTTIGTVEY